MTASIPRTLPTVKNIKDMFEELLGRAVAVASADRPTLQDIPRMLVASYRTDRRVLGAVMGLELSLAAYAGAAVGLLPAGGAKDCVKDGALSLVLSENVFEICNILASTLNQEGCAHLRLERVHLPGEQPDEDVVQCLLAIGRSMDLDVAIAGYGSGRLSVGLA